MSTDVASIMLPVSRGLMDRDRELDPMAGVHPNAGVAPAIVRGMKRGDPEPDGQAAAALVDSTGAECKRPRIDGSGGIAEVGQVSDSLSKQRNAHATCRDPASPPFIVCTLLLHSGVILTNAFM